MGLNPAFWAGRRVLLTGHTGFKGGWLGLWLADLGAEVMGYALAPITTPALWQEARLNSCLDGVIGDIRDSDTLLRVINGFAPEIVLHLAAQPLVRESYRAPLETYAVNVMGTLNLLEAIRQCDSVRAVVVVTTDKCYHNQEWLWAYREQDALGGLDPYSNSKACVELLCAAYREAFLRPQGVALATARAGNVLGGGDWSAERLLPDLFRAWQQGQPLCLRYPHATRPWQHVLEPLLGYLLLAQGLVEQGDSLAAAWNFGPAAQNVATVAELVGQLAELWPGCPGSILSEAAHPPEAGLLALDSSRAGALLGWQARWPLSEVLQRTLAWQQAWLSGQDMFAFSRQQIRDYQDAIL